MEECSKVKKDFKRHIYFKVGNGGKVLFSLDHYCDDTVLKDV